MASTSFITLSDSTNTTAEREIATLHKLCRMVMDPTFMNSKDIWELIPTRTAFSDREQEQLDLLKMFRPLVKIAGTEHILVLYLNADQEHLVRNAIVDYCIQVTINDAATEVMFHVNGTNFFDLIKRIANILLPDTLARTEEVNKVLTKLSEMKPMIVYDGCNVTITIQLHPSLECRQDLKKLKGYCEVFAFNCYRFVVAKVELLDTLVTLHNLHLKYEADVSLQASALLLFPKYTPKVTRSIYTLGVTFYDLSDEYASLFSNIVESNAKVSIYRTSAWLALKELAV
jgi:hypothetical protein